MNKYVHFIIDYVQLDFSRTHKLNAWPLYKATSCEDFQ